MRPPLWPDKRSYPHNKTSTHIFVALLRFPSLQVDLDAELAKLKSYAERLRPMVCDTVHFVNTAIQQRKKVVVEGANAAMLDIDFGEGIMSFWKKRGRVGREGVTLTW